MRKLVASLALATASLPQLAVAGPYTDDLSKCLVASTTPADKTVLTQWMFSVFAMPKDVARYTTLTDRDRDGFNRQVAALFMRLMTESCKTQLHDAYQYEGVASITASFEVLGKVASIGLMQDPAVSKGMTDFSKYLDEDKIALAAGKQPEAGK